MNYYSVIKEQLINNEIYKMGKDYSKNRSDLETYYSVGKLLSEAGKSYGDGIIKEYSRKLSLELDKKYTVSLLYKIKQFYFIYEKVPTLSGKMTWSHWYELLPIKDINKVSYYVKICEEQNLGVRDLRKKIKSNEYERLDENTRSKLINNEEEKIEDFIKNPVLIRNSYNEEISEKLLKRLILEDLDNFLLELGDGFCYIKNEYRIKIGDRYNFIDVLLFNIKYNCYVVLELKITEIKVEHIAQIKKYMNYIDKNVKSINQDNTIGIVICKRDNVFVMEYCSDDRVYRTTYKCV